jgi:uncharacterized protein
MKKTNYHSYCSGNIAKGCQQCVKGEKLVVFITGLCPRNCYFCPISEKKYGKDKVFADEWPIKNPDKPKELIKEAELINAKGAGITGGDPLTKIDRTCKYIKILKKKFGKKFHIHLYTSLSLVNENNLKILYQAGLDEIRFHPDLDDKTSWSRINLAKKYKWSIGIEIPTIPGKEKETKELIDFIIGKTDFLNLNELELSSTTTKHYTLNKTFKAKDDLSYAVKGSLEIALKLGNYAEKKGLKVHVCTVKLKDSIQLKNRILRRAKNIKKKYEILTDEGTLIKGCIYLKELKPGINYKKKIEEAKKSEIFKKLKKLRLLLIKELSISNDLINVDTKKLRIITSPILIDELKNEIKKFNLDCAIVEEYPTWDLTEIDVQIL